MKKLVWSPQLLLTALAAGAFIFYYAHIPLLRELFSFFYLFFAGYLITQTFRFNNKLSALFLALPVVLIPLVGIGALMYYFYQFDELVLYILLTLPFCGAWGAIFFQPKGSRINIPFSRPGILDIFLSIFFLVVLSFYFFLLFHFQTTESILGPWARVREPILFTYFLLSFILLAVAYRKTRLSVFLPLLSLFYFASFSVTAILFPLGFGYDPILHQQTERHILEHGFILPKTPYYLGQYVLIVFLSKLFSLPLALIDTFFLPLFASFTLPVSFLLLFKKVYGLDTYCASMCGISFLIIPFSFFVLTTPWGFALTLTILLLVFSLLYNHEKSKELFILLLFLFVALFCVHPLAGIVISGFFSFFLLTSHTPHFFLKHPNTKKICMSLLFLLLSGGALGAFLLNSHLSSQLFVMLKKPHVQDVWFLITPLLPAWSTNFHIIYDFAYFFQKNGVFFFIILACIGTYISRTITGEWKKSVWVLWGGFFLTCVQAFFLTLFLEFPSLIWYERMSYITRILECAPFFLLPFFFVSLARFWKKIHSHHNPLFSLGSILICSSLLTSSLYLSYPHVDPYTNYHGYNLSRADLETVHWIHDDMGSQQCIVLANQMVAVAAIREFGFTGYRTIIIQGRMQNLFYYPIPTGSPLYPHFLHMIASPEREIISQAMSEFHVSCAYFVVNHYETRFQTLIMQAKNTTSEFVAFDNEANYVFKYRR